VRNQAASELVKLAELAETQMVEACINKDLLLETRRRLEKLRRSHRH
jgi:hypothetical protein